MKRRVYKKIHIQQIPLREQVCRVYLRKIEPQQYL